jgi:uncharacterized protein (UPF0332 family)
MSLENWLQNKWLQVHETSAQEIEALLRSASNDLRSAGSEGISDSWRLSMAYTAALRYARAALYASGYRPAREREHERTIDSLRYTLTSLPADTVKVLHKIRKKRHEATYESADSVSDVEADAAIRAAVGLGKTLTDWLRAKHPRFVE